MRHTTRIILAVAASAWGCALTVQKPVAYGREVRVRTLAPSRVPEAPDDSPSVDQDGPEVRGELISIDEKKVTVIEPNKTTRELPRQAVRDVSVRQHRFGGGKGLVWTLAGGLVTSGALAASCSTTSSGCGTVFSRTMLFWGVVGGLSSAFLESSTFKSVGPDEDLRRFARFPQGLPAGSDAASLLTGRHGLARSSTGVGQESDAGATQTAHDRTPPPRAVSGAASVPAESAPPTAE